MSFFFIINNIVDKVNYIFLIFGCILGDKLGKKGEISDLMDILDNVIIY